MDFASMLSGGSGSGSSSPFDLGSLITGLSGTAGPKGSGGGGSGIGNALSGVGNLVGNFIPGAGLVGQGLGAVVNLFDKGHQLDGAGLLSDWHSPSLAPMDDSQMFKEDVVGFINLAKLLDISVEEAGMLMAWHCDIFKQPPGIIYDGFRSGTSFVTIKDLGQYNALHAGQYKIVAGQKGPVDVRVSTVKALVNYSGSPAIIDLNTKMTDLGNQYAAGTPLGTSIYTAQAAMYPQGVPLGVPIVQAAAPASLVAGSQSLASTTGTGVAFNNAASQASDKGTLLAQLADAMWKGAKTGATDVLADTDAAKAAKADYFKEFVATYQLPLAAGGIGLVLLIKKAFYDHNG